MYNGKIDTLQQLIQINKSLDDINMFNENNIKNFNKKNIDKEQNNINNYNYNYNHSSILNSEIDINKNSSLNISNNNYQEINKNISNIQDKNSQNNNNSLEYNSPNSPLNELININKKIDSVYDNMQLMKSSNKINSKVLYNISHSSQTFEEF